MGWFSGLLKAGKGLLKGVWGAAKTGIGAGVGAGLSGGISRQIEHYISPPGASPGS